MGVIGRVLSATRVEINGQRADDIRAELGTGEVVTAHHFGTAGDDSPPRVGDLVLLARGQGAGVFYACGYVDPDSSQDAAPGDRRVYARDSGGVVASVWVKANGSLVVESTGDVSINGVTIAADGATNINGVTISTAGVVTLPGGKVLNDHTHGGVTAGGGVTGPNI
jgi:hypothetical protein